MVACIFLTVFLPIALAILLGEFNEKIVARSQSTPMVLGAKGSGLDLTLQSIYFRQRTPDTIPFGKLAETESVEVDGTQLVTVVPIHSRFTAQGFPVVGTDLRYFDFRELEIARGDSLTLLGDCVLGYSVARKLGLAVGDQLLTDKENSVSMTGDYPLKMNVRGILARSNSPDDNAVFVSLKTAWVVEGLGHGHQSLENEMDKNLVIRKGDKVEARATVQPFIEINESNIDSFHFHGDPNEFPISALIAYASDPKSETLFMARYLGSGGKQVDDELQLVRPIEEVSRLMEMVFRVKQLFFANALLVSISTVLLLVLVVLLSMRLRAGEMATMFKLGCSRGTIALLQIGELLLVFLIAGVAVGLAVLWVRYAAGGLVERLIG